MPDQFDFCCYDLTQTGASAEMAKRACSIAFWQENGMSADVAAKRGVNPPGSITVAAKRVYSQLSASGQMMVCVSSDPVREVARMDQFASYEPSTEPCSRELREAVILYPGTYNGVDFTADDCKAYADNFDPGNPPPIILDHDMTNADNCHGYVRGLAWDAENQVLVALAEFLGEHAVERVNDRRWKRLSGAFMVSEDRLQKVVVELSVTLRPAVGGARVLSKINTMEATMPDPETEKDEAVPAEVAADTEKTAEAEVSPPEAAPIVKMSAEQAELITLRAQVAKAESAVAKMEAERLEIRAKADARDWELLLAQGYTEPQLAEKEMAHLATLSQEQKESFLTILRERGRMHTFGRKSSPDIPQAPIEDKKVQLSEKEGVLMDAMRSAAGITTSTNGQTAK